MPLQLARLVFFITNRKKKRTARESRREKTSPDLQVPHPKSSPPCVLLRCAFSASSAIQRKENRLLRRRLPRRTCLSSACLLRGDWTRGRRRVVCFVTSVQKASPTSTSLARKSLKRAKYAAQRSSLRQIAFVAQENAQVPRRVVAAPPAQTTGGDRKENKALVCSLSRRQRSNLANHRDSP